MRHLHTMPAGQYIVYIGSNTNKGCYAAYAKYTGYMISQQYEYKLQGFRFV